MEHQKERALTNTQRGLFAVVHYLLTHFKGEEVAPGIYDQYTAMYLCPFKDYNSAKCVWQCHKKLTCVGGNDDG